MALESHLLSLSPIVYTLLGAAALWTLYYYLIYPLTLSPLARIPGPKLAALSSLYLDSHYAVDKGIPYIRELFERYGPIVRVGPNEVVVNDSETLSTIYGVRSNFPKPPTATLFENYDTPNAFSTRYRDDHRQRRKPVSKVYTMSSVLNNTKLMACLQGRLDKVVGQIDAKLGKPVDIFSMSIKFALDNVSFQVYGETLDLLGGNNLAAVENVRAAAIASVRLVRFPWLHRFLCIWPFTYVMPRYLKRALASRDFLESINMNAIKKATNSMKEAGEKVDPDSTTLGCYRSQRDYGTILTEKHVASECVDHVVAGGDTTGVSITYLLYTLARPEYTTYQPLIREEISTLPYPYNFKDVCNLPILSSCVQEVLRLYAPGPGGLQQRMTPDGESTTMMIKGKKYLLPANTVVGIQAYSLHRNEEVFGKKVDEFWLKRWEVKDEARLQKMNDALISFGYGARTCLGMNLAYVEIKTIVATLLREFEVELPPNAKKEDMDPIFGGVIRPKAERCDLVFRRLRQ